MLCIYRAAKSDYGILEKKLMLCSSSLSRLIARRAGRTTALLRKEYNRNALSMTDKTIVTYINMQLFAHTITCANKVWTISSPRRTHVSMRQNMFAQNDAKDIQKQLAPFKEHRGYNCVCINESNGDEQPNEVPENVR